MMECETMIYNWDMTANLVEKDSIADKTDIMHVYVYDYTAIAFVGIFSIVVAITFVLVMLDEML